MTKSWARYKTEIFSRPLSTEASRRISGKFEHRAQLAVAEAVAQAELQHYTLRNTIEHRVQLAMAEAVATAESRHSMLLHEIERIIQLTVAEAITQAEMQHGMLRQEIERRGQLAVAEAGAQAGERHSTLRHEIERRTQLAVAEAGAQAEERHSTLRHEIERRAQLAVAEAGAQAEERHSTLRHEIERRAQLSVSEACAIADVRIAFIEPIVQSFQQHMPAFLNAVSSVSAFSYGLATLRREVETNKMQAKAELTEGIARTRKLFEEHLQNIERRAEIFETLHRQSILDAASNTSTLAQESDAFRREFDAANQESRETALKAASHTATLVQEIAALRRELNAVAATTKENAETALKTASHAATVAQEAVTRPRDLDTIASADRANLWQVAREANKNIGELWKRLEFVRKEIMYEMRFGLPRSGVGNGGGPTASEIRILSTEKLKTAQINDDLRLNLGCGHVPLDGYINIDMRDLPGVDILAGAGSLPFESGTVREIFSAHMLEHFPQEQLRYLLPYWRSLLRKDGMFRAVVPDGEAMLAGIGAGTYSFEDFRLVLFGAQEYEGDFHFNMLTPDSLAELLREANFTDIQIPIKGRVNSSCFEFEIQALPDRLD